jgi:hypothetical protein
VTERVARVRIGARVEMCCRASWPDVNFHALFSDRADEAKIEKR